MRVNLNENTRLSVYTNMGANNNKRTNWDEIQDYYDQGYSYRDLRNKFRVSMATIDRAKKRGEFIPRTKSEAVKLAHSKYKESFKRSEETRQKISKSRIKFLEENPDKVPYVLNHYSKGDSYPEQYFDDLFKNEYIKVKKKHRISIYELDFADVDKKIDIEIDGEQHYLDERIIQSDIRRTKYLESKGWTVYRVRWSDYQKLSYNDKQLVIQEIKSLIS